MSWGPLTATTPTNAQILVRDYLKAQGLKLDGVDVTVRGPLPKNTTPTTPLGPTLTVLDQGASDYDQVSETTLIQVTAYADNPDPAWTLAALARSRLLALRGVPALRRVEPATRQAPTPDPTTGRTVCAFTVHVTARTTPS